MKRLNVVIISMFVIITIGVVVFAQEVEKVFALYIIVYKNNTVEFKDFGISQGASSIFKDIPSDYTLKIISLEEKILFEKPLPISFIAYVHGFPEDIEVPDGGVIELNESVVYLKLPYFPDADRVELYYRDEIIFSLDIKKYICQPDGVCSGDENELNCPQDCKKISGGRFSFKYVIIILLVIIVVLAVFFLKSRQEQPQESSQFYGYGSM